MTATLRVILVLISCFTAFFIVRKIRQSSLQIEDSLFWIGFVAILLIFSIFPQVPAFLSEMVGTMAPVNFIYLLIIFLLIVQLFRMTVHQSQLEAKLRDLVQEIAMDRNEREEETEKAGRKPDLKSTIDDAKMCNSLPEGVKAGEKPGQE